MANNIIERLEMDKKKLVFCVIFLIGGIPQTLATVDSVVQHALQTEDITDNNALLAHEKLDDAYDIYDREVCDNVQPPSVSPTTAWLRGIGIEVLLKCLAIKKCMGYYLTVAKQTLYGWWYAKKAKA